MGRRFVDMTDAEQKEYRMLEERLASSHYGDEEKAKMRRRIDQLEWKGPEEEVLKQIDELRKRVAVLEVIVMQNAHLQTEVDKAVQHMAEYNVPPAHLDLEDSWHQSSVHVVTPPNDGTAELAESQTGVDLDSLVEERLQEKADGTHKPADPATEDVTAADIVRHINESGEFVAKDLTGQEPSDIMSQILNTQAPEEPPTAP